MRASSFVTAAIASFALCVGVTAVVACGSGAGAPVDSGPDARVPSDDGAPAPSDPAADEEPDAGDADPGDAKPADGDTSAPGDDPPPPSDPTPADGDGDGDTTPGDPAGPTPCTADSNEPPQTPMILSPQPGAVGIAPGDLLITSSAFADPDGDHHAGSELEIWRVRDGEMQSLVWRADLSAPSTSARLTDGIFTGTGLAAWTAYAVRVRYRDDAPCSRTSAWSAAVTFRTDDGSAYLFDPEKVLRFYLTIPPASWDAINAEAVPDSCVAVERSYYPGAFTFEGTTYNGAGIRVKGGCGSSRALDEKAAFKVNIAWDDPAVPGCPVDARIYGEKHFTFNNMVQDGTMAHEMLGYQFFRALGLPEPRASEVRIYVNGEYWGVYLHLETIDRRYLARRFASNRGMLYEGTYFCDLIPANMPASENDSTCFGRKFDAGPCDDVEPGDDPVDFSLLRDLVARIEAMPAGEFYPQVEQFFDFETFLTQWAANGVISHWDSYENWVITNYRVYHDPGTGKWTLIQTGIDQSFEDDRDPWNVGGRLARRCLAESDCAAAFAKHVESALVVFEQMDLAAEAQRIYDRIQADVSQDPRKSFTMADFAAAHAALRQWIQGRPAAVRLHLKAQGF